MYQIVEGGSKQSQNVQ